MSQSEDAKYLASLKKRYKRASKKERGKILDEYVETTGYHRKHAIAVLGGQRTRKSRPIRRPRSAIYLMEDARARERLGDVFDGINSRLLRAALDNELESLYQSGFLPDSRVCYERLKRISPAGMDRLHAQSVTFIHEEKRTFVTAKRQIEQKIELRLRPVPLSTSLEGHIRDDDPIPTAAMAGTPSASLGAGLLRCRSRSSPRPSQHILFEG